jgi:hypothetical protein
MTLLWIASRCSQRQKITVIARTGGTKQSMMDLIILQYALLPTTFHSRLKAAPRNDKI